MTNDYPDELHRWPRTEVAVVLDMYTGGTIQIYESVPEFARKANRYSVLHDPDDTRWEGDI